MVTAMTTNVAIATIDKTGMNTFDSLKRDQSRRDPNQGRWARDELINLWMSALNRSSKLALNARESIVNIALDGSIYPG
jgi:hypothetical protein